MGGWLVKGVCWWDEGLDLRGVLVGDLGQYHGLLGES